MAKMPHQCLPPWRMAAGPSRCSRSLSQQTQLSHTWRGFPDGCFCAGPWVTQELWEPFPAVSQFATALWISCTWAPWFFKARCLELLSRVQVLKVGVSDGGYDPLAPHGEAPGWWAASWWWVAVLGMGCMTRPASPPLPASIWPFYCLLWRSILASFPGFPRGNWSICSYRFCGSVGGDGFGIFLCCHLGLCLAKEIFVCLFVFLKEQI